MPVSTPTATLLWFRKDLRLDDNHALQAALSRGNPVIPVYIREPEDSGAGPLGAAQAWWLHHSLARLADSLERHGSRLILRQGAAEEVLRTLIQETGADAVHWNRRYDPAGMAIDKDIKEALRADGLEAKSHAGFLLHEPSKIETGAGGPFRVYTPFWRALEKQGDPPPPVESPKDWLTPEQWPQSEKLADWHYLPTEPNWAADFDNVWTPGEAGAQERLKQFVARGIRNYKSLRDFPALPHTSGLSPHLALGEISPARIWHATIGLGDDVGTDDYVHFRKELVWREFSYHLLYHFPDLAGRNWNARFDSFPWKTNKAALRAWQRGETGYPIVDAGMRQLWRHGVMHNRVRMIVASFLIKDLMIDWREGEAWFRDTLVDADPASNAASWQWVAGSGADASPFFRIFNPITQGEKFDPDGAYVREFVPELAKLSNKLIHRPFEAPSDVLAAAGITLGKTYPKPLVDHAKAREAALEAFQQMGGKG